MVRPTVSRQDQFESEVASIQFSLALGPLDSRAAHLRRTRRAQWTTGAIAVRLDDFCGKP